MLVSHKSHYDLVVVGCGGVGSSVLYHAARRGIRALGVEQFTIAHDRGSSHGQTRIIRQAYFEHPNYVPLLLDAYRYWHDLEIAVGQQLFFQTGLLQAGPTDGIVVPGVLQSAREHGLEVESFSSQACCRRFPAFKIPESHAAVFEQKAGYLLVEKCVAAYVQAAVSSGADVVEQTQVHGITPHSDHVELETSAGKVRASAVVLTVGAWLGNWLHHPLQPLTVLRKHLHWYATEDSRLKREAGCPLFLFENERGCFYGFPSFGESGLKVSEHSGGQPMVDANQLDRDLDPDDVARIEQFLKETFFGEFRKIDHSVCMYTMTRDQHFLIDRLPDCERVLLAGGMSGHGFKFASVIGKLVADWAIDQQKDPRIDFLRLDRDGTL